MSFLDQFQLIHLEHVEAAFREKYGIMFKINFVPITDPQTWQQTLKIFVKNMDTGEVITNSVKHDFIMRLQPSLNPDYFANLIEQLMMPIVKQCDEWANIKKNIDLIKGL